MDELAIKIEHVSKQYRLGTIGGGTLQEDLQSWWALKHGKEDPNSKIGSNKHLKRGERFLALDDINLEVKKGEALGIIGHNGAGKSTLLKLLSRVTAPTEGTISYNGRITSMLEVGTGFHRELTGRENIYMNGAILGMSKKEVAEKIEQIIDFSEVREFIDTPVKRYSSGMYVKLAFSVAAHLDSEIMIMDEVLAVGDMAFQKKCLTKMREAADKEGRTVLYVSHNMNTIRTLCDRCIVLDHGKIIFDGDVEEAIELYMGMNNTSDTTVNLEELQREKWVKNDSAIMKRLEIDAKDSCFVFGDKIKGKLTIRGFQNYSDCVFKVFFHQNGVPVTTMESPPCVSIKANKDTDFRFELNLGHLAPARYTTKLVLCRRNGLGGVDNMDVLLNCYMFEIVEPESFHDNQKWSLKYNGYLVGDTIKVLNA